MPDAAVKMPSNAFCAAHRLAREESFARNSHRRGSGPLRSSLPPLRFLLDMTYRINLYN